MKGLKHWFSTLLETTVWTVHHLASGGWPTEREVTMNNVRRGVKGEYSEKTDYQHLPPWQWTSVADLQEMGILEPGENRS